MSISVNEAIAWADRKREELEGFGLSSDQVYILEQVYDMAKGQFKEENECRRQGQFKEDYCDETR